MKKVRITYHHDESVHKSMSGGSACHDWHIILAAFVAMLIVLALAAFIIYTNTNNLLDSNVSEDEYLESLNMERIDAALGQFE